MATRKASKPSEKFVSGADDTWVRERCRDEYENREGNPLDLQHLRSGPVLEEELSTAKEVRDLLLRAQRIHDRHRRLLEEMKVFVDDKLQSPPKVIHAAHDLAKYVYLAGRHLAHVEELLQLALKSRRDVRSGLHLLVEELMTLEGLPPFGDPPREHQFSNRQIALIAIIKGVERPEDGETVEEVVGRVRKKVASTRGEVLKKRQDEENRLQEEDEPGAMKPRLLSKKNGDI